uniref:Phenylethanolamine N-methyltransferase n=1 Tax=Erpetoichthys calabaricus TaxID=27687 RepID=A0A8C4T2R7_ERPCA
IGRGDVPEMERADKEVSVAAMKEYYKQFDPRSYLRYNYIPPRADFTRTDSIVPWKLSCLHLIVFHAIGDVHGRTLIDIGSGPTIYQLLSACEHFSNIIMTDFLEVNRQEIRRWLHGEPDTFDWTAFLQHACELEGKGCSWPEKAKRLRTAIHDVIPIDVHSPNPLHPYSLPELADCLVSSFCLEAVSPDRTSFQKALTNLGTLLKPNGHFLMIGALDESYYQVADGVHIPVVPVDQEFVSATLKSCGYEICTFQCYTLPQDMKVGVDDVAGIFFVKAKKK